MSNKITLKAYTNPILEKHQLIYAEDLTELRDNALNILQQFYPHHDSLNNNNINQEGSDNNPDLRVHDLASETQNGFASYTLYEEIQILEELLDVVEGVVKYSLFPEMSIVLWDGDKDALPQGWALCDGKAELYVTDTGESVKTPNLSYVEIISEGSNRPVYSLQPGFQRELATSGQSYDNFEGVAKVYWYIIKKPRPKK